jgi:predicted O-methyltransferase YrrM
MRAREKTAPSVGVAPSSSLQAICAYAEAARRTEHFTHIRHGRATRVLLYVARIMRQVSEETAIYSARRIVAATVAERPTIEEAMAFAYALDLRGFEVSIRPLQIPAEIEALLERVQAAQPRTIVEIGTACGGTMFLLATAAGDDAHIVSIDLPQGYKGRRQKLYRAFGRKGQRVDLLRRDSHDPETVRLTERLVGDHGVDLLFIDGDHSYEGVERDYLAYSPLVRDGGVIAFHDIVPGIEANVEGVPRFWQKLRRTAEVEELVQDWGQGDCGIGLLQVKRA